MKKIWIRNRVVEMHDCDVMMTYLVRNHPSESRRCKNVNNSLVLPNHRRISDRSGVGVNELFKKYWCKYKIFWRILF